MRVIKQIISEFWIQFLISIGWATYQVWPIGANILSVSKALPTFITNFSGSFFFLSWGMGQFFRIKRQNEVKDEFSKVKSELSNLLDLVREKTEFLIGHTTGADSIGWFEPVQISSDVFQLIFTNSSKYPLVDVNGDWVEITEPFDIYATRNPFNLGTVGTSTAVPSGFVEMNGKDKTRIHIFIRTRTRFIIQQMIVMQVDGMLSHAYRIEADGFDKTEAMGDFPIQGEELSNLFS